jgi:hypothetical protein
MYYQLAHEESFAAQLLEMIPEEELYDKALAEYSTCMQDRDDWDSESGAHGNWRSFDEDPQVCTVCLSQLLFACLN